MEGYDASLLALYPMLSSLAPALYQRLLESMRYLSVPAGSVLFDERQPCSGFSLLLAGKVRVVKVSPNGRELPLYRVHAGEICLITSSCLLGKVDYNARGIAEEACTIAVLPKELFDELMAEPAFRGFVFNLFSERLSDLMQLVEEVAFRKLDQRLAGLLLGRGRLIHMTHQQLADELGSVREMVSRLLKGFADEGLVQLGREQVEVLDPARLREISAGAA